MIKFFQKYYSVNNVKWFFSILCVFFGFACYAAAYDPNGTGDEIVFLLALSFSIIIYLVFWKLFEVKINNITSKFQDLVDGKFIYSEEDNKGLNDFKELNHIQERFVNYINDVKKGIIELENKNLDFEITNKEEYFLKESVYNLQQQLIELKKEEEQNNWINEGLANFVDILRSDSGNIEKLSQQIISNLVKYTNSNQAGIYILNEKRDNLKQIAFFAYDRDKYTDKEIPEGYGLLWQCLFEKKPIHLNKIPDNYITIRSGLGGDSPKSLLLIPLLLEEETFGVIELASFNDYKPYEVEFIEKLAENIASSISSARTVEKTQQLLAESNSKTLEMQEQEQSMRQNMEELQSTQEEMERVQKEMEFKDNNMKSLLDSSTDTFFAIDTNYKILIVNKTLRERFRESGITLTEGMSIFDCIPEDQHKSWKKRYDKCLKGEDYNFDSERKKGDEIYYYRAYYSAIRNNDGEIIGCSVRSTDISEYYQLSLESMDLKREVMQLKSSSSKQEGSENKEDIDSRIKKAKSAISKLKKN